MGGYCYGMDDDKLAELDELPKVEKIGEQKRDSDSLPRDVEKCKLRHLLLFSLLSLISDKMPRIIHLGKGRCRGPDWAARVWPIELGPKMIKDCARECATRRRCLAFDLSEMHGRNDSGNCALYGHRNVRERFQFSQKFFFAIFETTLQVAPASGVKGECFTLGDRDEEARGDQDDDYWEEEEEDVEEPPRSNKQELL